MSVKYFLLFFIVVACSCGDDSGDQQMSDDGCRALLISADDFTAQVVATAVTASIDGTCLTISVGVSGCDDMHDIDMITDGGLAESLPVQMTFILRDNDPQLCLAFFTIERQFDLEPLHEVTNEDQIWINFANSDTRVLYSR